MGLRGTGDTKSQMETEILDSDPKFLIRINNIPAEVRPKGPFLLGIKTPFDSPIELGF